MELKEPNMQAFMLVFHQDLRVDCVIISGQIMPFTPVILAIFIHYALSPFHNKLWCKKNNKIGGQHQNLTKVHWVLSMTKMSRRTAQGGIATKQLQWKIPFRIWTHCRWKFVEIQLLYNISKLYIMLKHHSKTQQFVFHLLTVVVLKGASKYLV